MNTIKKRTLIDKFRDAYRAFRGKQISSLTFGIDVKRCSDCDYKNLRPYILYLCDQKACQNCSYPMCRHTTDIEHAKNFKYSFRTDIFEEVEHD